MKPEALRSIETYIWRNLSLVSRRQLTAEAMIDLVLDSVVSPDITVAFSGEDARFKKELRKHFASLFEEERDDTSFFFPSTIPPLNLFIKLIIFRCHYNPQDRYTFRSFGGHFICSKFQPTPVYNVRF